MGGLLSLLRSDHKFAGYERSLERIGKELKEVQVCVTLRLDFHSVQSAVVRVLDERMPVQGRIKALEHRKRHLQTLTLFLLIVSGVICAVYIGKVRFPQPYLGCSALVWGYIRVATCS
jgi:hypothetical protein